MKIAFWGDSLTEGWPGHSFFSILEKELTDITILNYGCAGDTAKSLHSRLVRTPGISFWDYAFLWVGTNDVFYYGSVLGSLSKNDFSKYYLKIIDHLLHFTDTIILIPPLIIDENPEFNANKLAEKYSSFIESLPKQNKSLQYLNLRKKFLEQIIAQPETTFTTDGVHLNKQGAKLIASWIAEKIREFI